MYHSPLGISIALSRLRKSMVSHRVCCGDRIGYSQFLTGEIVVDGEVSLLRQLFRLPVHPAAAEELLGRELIQDRGEGMFRKGEWGVKQPVSAGNGKREDDTVCLVGPAEGGF